MSVQTVKHFQRVLKKANGDRIKMNEAFRNISRYLRFSISQRNMGETRNHYLNRNPKLKEIHEWSGTVLINKKYQLVNY